jgi:hypothetical protein
VGKQPWGISPQGPRRYVNVSIHTAPRRCRLRQPISPCTQASPPMPMSVLVYCIKEIVSLHTVLTVRMRKCPIWFLLIDARNYQNYYRSSKGSIHHQLSGLSFVYPGCVIRFEFIAAFGAGAFQFMFRVSQFPLSIPVRFTFRTFHPEYSIH